MIANTPKPSYYAVIFSNIQTDDLQSYDDMAAKMETLAAQQPGYLGFESTRNNLGIAVSYWKDEQSIYAWQKNVEHQVAQKMGRTKWYASYKVRICKVERDYSLENSSN